MKKIKACHLEWIATFICVALVAIACAVSLFGCAFLPPTAPAPPVKYQLTLTGSVDGQHFGGFYVGSPAQNHAIQISSTIAVNYFTMQSCHRSVQFSDVIKVPWYDWAKDNKSFSFTYAEAPTIEDSGDCPLRFCAFSNVVGSPPSSCAVIDFESSKYSLPSQNLCNGYDQAVSGTSICSTQVGLIERAQFAGPVVIAPPLAATANAPASAIVGQCQGQFLDANQTLFQYSVPENECVVIFMEKAAPNRRAKLTVIPYDSALYPGGS